LHVGFERNISFLGKQRRYTRNAILWYATDAKSAVEKIRWNPRGILGPFKTLNSRRNSFTKRYSAISFKLSAKSILRTFEFVIRINGNSYANFHYLPNESTCSSSFPNKTDFNKLEINSI